ncbi:uncharacterized protein M6G45_014973 isoform 1-T1 [Spheniscus humboldti]
MPLPGLKTEDGKGEQALGVKPPESVLPVIEGSSVQESKSKMTHQGRRKTDIPACKGHRRVGQEVCYLCMQQEERNLRAALLEEKEKQERAERAQQQAWLASMAALSAQRRACAVLKMAVDKTETKEDLEESRDYLVRSPQKRKPRVPRQVTAASQLCHLGSAASPWSDPDTPAGTCGSDSPNASATSAASLLQPPMGLVLLGDRPLRLPAA